MFKVLKDKAFVKKFFSLAFPVMIQALIGLTVNFVDNLMVGGLTNEAVSAVYAVNQGTFFFIVISYGIVSGAGIYVQQFFGAKDDDHLRQSVRYKILAVTLLLAVFLPLFFFGGSTLIGFYTRSATNAQEILRLGMQYLPIILLSLIPMAYTTVYATTFRETGKTIYPLITGIIALVTNIGFNALMIYGLDMGVVGAAIATVIARCVEFIATFILVKKINTPFSKGVFSHFHIEKKMVKIISKKSFPLFFNEVLWAGGMVMLSLAYAQRDGVLSALSIVYTMTDIFGIVFQGLSVGIGVMVGNLLGAGKIEEAKENNKKLFILGIFISLVAGVVMAILAFVAPYMFVEVTPEQKLLATKLLLVYASFLWAFSLSVCSYMTLRAGGKTLITFLFDSMTMWVFVVPTTWALALFTGLDIVVIFIVVQSFDVAKALIGVGIVSRGTWAVNLTHGISKQEVQNPLL